MKQKTSKKTEISTGDYLKITKTLDNTENTGREGLILLGQQSSPRCRDDITQTNKSLIGGRYHQSPPFEINNQSMISAIIPIENCSDDKKIELEPEEQKIQSNRANDLTIMNLKQAKKLKTITEKEKSESFSKLILDISQIDAPVNHENITNNIINQSNVLSIEECKNSENIAVHEDDEENIFQNKILTEYIKKSKQKDIDKKLNNIILNLENFPDNYKENNEFDKKLNDITLNIENFSDNHKENNEKNENFRITEKFNENDKKDAKQRIPTTNDTIDEIEKKLRTTARIQSKSTLIPLQLGDIGIICEQESEIEKNKIVELSNKESERSIANACLVCFDKPPDAVLMNCGHGGIYLPLHL